MTYLCVPIFVRDFDAARSQIAAATAAGANMIELRTDAWPDLSNPLAIKAFGDLAAVACAPCVFTCRSEREGGRATISEDDRIDLLHRASLDTSHFHYVDIELAVPQHPFSRDARLIISAHDFTGRPERLYNILMDMEALCPAVNKIVWTARTVRDNLEAFEVLSRRNRPTIALCMGEAGIISRILAKKFGAFLSFASLDKDSATAPGQVSITDLKTLYRWDAIRPQTKVYGVVGHPIAHSMSPAIHNAAFDATKHDGVYVPFLVEPGWESFKAFMETFLAFKPLDLSGLSITLPHKENALRYLKEKNADIEPLAARIGAVNTIVIDASGNLKGLNTDYAAILDSITDNLKITREDLSKYRIAVLGAGGTGRTAVAALVHYGATVTIYNRTLDRATTLAAEFNGQPGKVAAALLDQLPHGDHDIYINTTAVGMSPNITDSPLPDGPIPFSKKTLVFDTIYTPIETCLLQQAATKGAKTINGVEMFLRQAAAQFHAWTGQEAPREIMRKIIERRLSEK